MDVTVEQTQGHENMKNKSVLVTGSTSGIGLAIASEFARNGSRVIINSFSSHDSNYELAEHLGRDHGADVTYIPADLFHAAEARNLVSDCGGVDILINNAGIQHVAPVEDFPVNKWNQVLAVNLSATFHTTAAALPHMREAGWGRIINISSVHGLTASPHKAAYIAAKHGMVGLTKVIALETAEEPITCNAICPGFVLTPLVESQIPDHMRVRNMDRDDVIREIMLARQPSGKFVEPSQLAETAVFLCTEAADQITGTTIAIDGGWTAL